MAMFKKNKKIENVSVGSSVFDNEAERVKALEATLDFLNDPKRKESAVQNASSPAGGEKPYAEPNAVQPAAGDAYAAGSAGYGAAETAGVGGTGSVTPEVSLKKEDAGSAAFAGGGPAGAMPEALQKPEEARANAVKNKYGRRMDYKTAKVSPSSASTAQKKIEPGRAAQAAERPVPQAAPVAEKPSDAAYVPQPAPSGIEASAPPAPEAKPFVNPNANYGMVVFADDKPRETAAQDKPPAAQAAVDSAPAAMPAAPSIDEKPTGNIAPSASYINEKPAENPAPTASYINEKPAENPAPAAPSVNEKPAENIVPVPPPVPAPSANARRAEDMPPAARQKKPEPIANPLPVPKKHVPRELDFDIVPEESDMHFDLVDLDGRDYFDIN